MGIANARSLACIAAAACSAARSHCLLAAAVDDDPRLIAAAAAAAAHIRPIAAAVVTDWLPLPSTDRLRLAKVYGGGGSSKVAAGSLWRKTSMGNSRSHSHSHSRTNSIQTISGVRQATRKYVDSLPPPDGRRCCYGPAYTANALGASASERVLRQSRCTALQFNCFAAARRVLPVCCSLTF